MPHKLANTKPYKLSPRGRQIKMAADRIEKTGLPAEQIDVIIDVLMRHGGSDSGISAVARVYEQRYIDFTLCSALRIGAHSCLKSTKGLQDEVRRRGRVPATEFIEYLNRN